MRPLTPEVVSKTTFQTFPSDVKMKCLPGRKWMAVSKHPATSHIKHHLLSPLISKRWRNDKGSSHTEVMSHSEGRLCECKAPPLPVVIIRFKKTQWLAAWSLFIFLFNSCFDKWKQSEDFIMPPFRSIHFSAPIMITF